MPLLIRSFQLVSFQILSNVLANSFILGCQLSQFVECRCKFAICKRALNNGCFLAVVLIFYQELAACRPIDTAEVGLNLLLALVRNGEMEGWLQRKLSTRMLFCGLW